MRNIPCDLPAIEAAILGLKDQLNGIEAIGVMGSFARGDFDERSDIDIFVIVKERKPGYDIDRIWWERVNDILSKFRRDVTVITYSIKGLKKILTWYVLRLASEGILIYDKGGIKELFDKIVNVARNAGLVEKKIGNRKVWSAPNLKFGERLVLEIKE